MIAFIADAARRVWRFVKPLPFDESNVLRYIRNLFKRR